MSESTDNTVINIPSESHTPKSFQVRALVRKTISYQKRQTVTNICCVSLCPVLMVAISALLGTLLTTILLASVVPQEFMSCSNANAFDPETNLPLVDIDQLPTVDARQIPGATPGLQVRQTNFFISSASDSPSDAASLTSCVLWAQPDYNTTDPYERDPFAAPLPSPQDVFFDPSLISGQFARQFARSSSIYEPDPRYGWLNPFLSSSPQYLVALASKQQFPWAFVIEPQGVDLGSKSRKANFTLAEAPLRAATINIGDGGILGQFRTQYYGNIAVGSGNSTPTLESFQPIPYFTKFGNNDPQAERLFDDSLTQLIQDTVSKLSALGSRNSNNVGYTANVTRIVNEVPWGTLIVRQWNTNLRQFHYVWQIGEDSRVARSSSYPSEGFRRFLMNSMLSNSIMKSLVPGNSIVQGLRAFPSLVSTNVELPVGSIIGRVLFPFGVSFLLPIFVIILVQEKEARIHVMMKMNGMKSITYFFAHALHFFLLHVLSTAFFLVSGYLFELRFFTATQFSVLLVIFLVWGFVQIALSFFIASFFSETRNALVMSFLAVLLSVIISMATDTLFVDEAPDVYLIWPPFAFYRALTVINNASFDLSSRPYTLSALTGDDEVLKCLIYMVVEVVVYFFLAFYLTSVLPSQYGVRKPWHYLVSEPWAFLMKKSGMQLGSNHNLYQNVDIDPGEVELEDDDVRAERHRVDANLAPSDSLVIRHMRKAYDSGKLAVKDVTLATESGEIFGLLGPNGAGKSTLISILTGIYEPSSGSATLSGYDILTQREDVYRITGICPQHDILWDDLTVGEHILFYARLKGVPPHEENNVKERVLKAISLHPFEDRLSKGLSGGEKRRLSIGIALTGSPKVVFLDEPTTGLDPELRRSIWKIIMDARENKTILLTTHSMEEAEVLCSRISIMNRGILRCLGNQFRLKQIYGSGFKLTFICKPENMNYATDQVLRILPRNSKVLDAFEQTKSIEFVPGDGELATIFQLLLQNSATYMINDWGISATSLEEVFLRIISNDDAEGT